MFKNHMISTALTFHQILKPLLHKNQTMLSETPVVQQHAIGITIVVHSVAQTIMTTILAVCSVAFIVLAQPNQLGVHFVKLG